MDMSNFVDWTKYNHDEEVITKFINIKDEESAIDFVASINRNDLYRKLHKDELVVLLRKKRMFIYIKKTNKLELTVGMGTTKDPWFKTIHIF
jgi:hypothetical protein